MVSSLRQSTKAALIAVLLCAGLAVGLLAAPTNASALTVGIGDNGPGMFAEPDFQRLGSKISRKIIPWDFHRYEWDRENLKQWIDGAKAQGVQPLIAFNHSTRSPRRLPTIGQFKYSLRYLLRNHPEVRTFSPWNEANHHTQPTAKNPRRAAQYYNVSRQVCRGCRIVAADVLDQKNMIPWIDKFRRYAKRPSLWGLHSYADTNRYTPWHKSATRRLLSHVRGKIWLTEVGGLVAFGRNFRYSEYRAKVATKRTLLLAKKSRRIQRVYLYSWYGTYHPSKRTPYRWDSGLMSHTGEPRAAYDVVRVWFQRNR